jgi:integrase
VRQEWLQTFDRKSDAEAFEAKVKLLKRSDELGDLDAGKEPLEEFVAEWWLLYAERHLKPKTRKQYRDLRDRFVLPRLGKLPLRKPTPRIIETWAAELAADGVPDATLRKMLGMLQGIFERAITWGRVKSNPVKAVKKPATGWKRLIRALSPAEVEALRAALTKLFDKTLISVLGYGGLRPGEALALTWGDIGDVAIAVDKTSPNGVWPAGVRTTTRSSSRPSTDSTGVRTRTATGVAAFSSPRRKRWGWAACARTISAIHSRASSLPREGIPSRSPTSSGTRSRR